MCFKTSLFFPEWLLREKDALNQGHLLRFVSTDVLLFVTPLPFLLVLMDLDGYGPILNDLFLPLPFYHGLNIIVVKKFTSLVLCCFAYYITFKHVLISLFMSSTLAISTMSYLKTLENDAFTPQRYLRCYTYFWLVASTGRNLMGYLILTLLCSGLFGYTLTAWFSINCYYQLPTFLLLGTIAATVGGTSLAICILELAVQCRLKSKEIVRKKTAFYFTFNRSRRNYFLLMQWKAQQAIPLTCGERFALGEGTVMNFLRVLSENITNAVLLIFP